MPNLLAIEGTAEITRTDDYRVYPITARDLWFDGVELDEDEDTATLNLGAEHTKYVGGKWGGKFLRAPDVFFTILEKGKGKVVKLGDVTEVRRGFTTGANEFFFLDDNAIREWGIEPHYLRPAIKGARECSSIVLAPDRLSFKLLICHESKRDLKGTNVLDYIEWGEQRGYHKRPTCRGRERWWDLGERTPSFVNCNYLVNEIMRFHYTEGGVFVSDNFQEVHVPKGREKLLCFLLNSTLVGLFLNVVGRTNFGGGLIKIQTYEVAGLHLLNPDMLTKKQVDTLLEAGEMMSERPMLSITNEVKQPDRRALDEVVFDVLGLTVGEREAVYEAVVELVKNRLAKARSV